MWEVTRVLFERFVIDGIVALLYWIGRTIVGGIVIIIGRCSWRQAQETADDWLVRTRAVVVGAGAILLAALLVYIAIRVFGANAA